jgi:excinuclease ABC subunit C
MQMLSLPTAFQQPGKYRSSHRKLRKNDIRESGLQEIPGIGPSRKRALLMHFGTLKEIERGSLADLGKVPGVSAESARKIFEYFHSQPN